MYPCNSYFISLETLKKLKKLDKRGRHIQTAHIEFSGIMQQWMKLKLLSGDLILLSKPISMTGDAENDL